MPPIPASYTLTYDDFLEAHRAHRQRKRFLTTEPEPSPRAGCAWIAALAVLTLVALVLAYSLTGHTVTSPDGERYFESTSPIVTALMSFAPWPVIVGVFWLLLARMPLSRRLARPVLSLFLVYGLAAAVVTAFTDPATPASSPRPHGAASWLPLLPWLMVLLFTAFVFRNALRHALRVAWTGQPHLRDRIQLLATDDHLSIQSPRMRIEYTWQAFLGHTETPNLFVLFPSALSFHAIPKRAFATPADADAFRDLLTLKVPHDNPRPQGFAVTVPTPAPERSV